MKDFMGQDIHVSALVVWPVKSDSHTIHMRKGQVVKLNATSVTVRPDGQTASVTLKRVDNLVVLG